jgi:hypothetical protein
MKNILDKINKADEIQAKKTELGTHEVNLASVKDMQADAKRIETAIKRIEGLRSSFKAEVSKIELDALGDSGRNYSAVKEQAMQLGINPDSIPEIKNHFALVKRLSESLNFALFGKKTL